MTLILDNTKKNNCALTLKKLFPPGAVINSYAFYDGKMEFSLANDRRFVVANTISPPVYTFWACQMHDPRRLHEMVSSDLFKFEDEGMLSILQEKWHAHNSAFIRASLFFVLNRCSSTGLVSSGKIDFEQLNPTSMAKLKSFLVPENFHLNLVEKDLIAQIGESPPQSYHLVPAGQFSYNLFEHGKNIAIEETPINHRDLVKLCKNTDSKIAITYDYDPKVAPAFKGNTIIMVDKYGKETSHKERAEEIIVANF